MPKAFLSSVIVGLESERNAAAEGASTLGYDVSRAEDYGASPLSPQQACLQGVWSADVVLLILGARYGYLQGSGLSATHEEYREARERCPVLAFIQENVEREAAQNDFIHEVQQWGTGIYTEDFRDPDHLAQLVTRRLYELDVARATGPVDPTDMLNRAEELIPRRSETNEAVLVVAVTGGPRQAILRPAEIEDSELGDAILKQALFGEPAIFNKQAGTQRRFQDHGLTLTQDAASVRLDELGSVRIVMPATQRSSSFLGPIPALVEEELTERLRRAIRFAAWLLDLVDLRNRLTDVSIQAALLDAGYMPWRTQAEQERNPNSATVSRASERVSVNLSPPHRKRAALELNAAELAEDLMVLLRREIRGNL